MAVELPNIPETLATTVCANCGYSLHGLPPIGTCPECGTAYDQSEVILYGYGRGRHETLFNARGPRMIWLVIVGYLYVLPQLIFTPAWRLPYLGLGLLPVIYVLFRRQNLVHPGLVQVRLNSQRVVQYDDLTGPSVLNELFWTYAWILPPAAIVIVLGLHWLLPRSMDAGDFWSWLVIAAVGAIPMWVICRRFRRALQQVRDGAFADLNAVYRKPTSWTEIARFSLQTMGKETFRFRVQRKGVSFGGLELSAHGSIVDAEIRCTEEQAEQLRSLIDQWLAPAGAAALSKR